jgi:hypothetical protein
LPNEGIFSKGFFSLTFTLIRTCGYLGIQEANFDNFSSLILPYARKRMNSSEFIEFENLFD